MNNIYLIGMMGSGKTMVATLLAKKLGREMQEMDDLIVRREKMSVNDIFAQKGEAHFRQVEKAVLGEIADRKTVVVATGGGVVLDDDNIERMRASGTMIYLKASTDKLYLRLKDKTDRPLLKCASPKDELAKIYTYRSGLYEKADFAVDTENRTPAEVAEQIVQLLDLSGLL